MSKLISKDDFIKLFDNYDITISDSDYSRFEAYADLLCEWNEKINLTAITDIDKEVIGWIKTAYDNAG